jgi:hypothetical protein
MADSLQQLKANIFNFKESNSDILDLFEKIQQELGSSKFEYDTDFIRSNFSLSQDNGIDIELKIIENMILKTLNVPKIFWDSMIRISKKDEEDPHTGNYLYTKLTLDIFHKPFLLSSISNIYRNYDDIKWVMERSDSAYSELYKIRDTIFPYQIKE